MKTVFSNAQVAHVWAAQSQEYGRGSNFYFHGPVIFSYRDTWPLAVFTPFKDSDGRRIVIVNAESVSVSTSRHLSYARSALHGLPVRVIETADRFSRETAWDLRDGKADAALRVAQDMANRARRYYSDALRKRDPWRAAFALESAATLFADARTLSGGDIGELPAMPELWVTADNYRNREPHPDLMSKLADARREQFAREAIAKFDAAVKELRARWNDARKSANGASVRLARAKAAMESLRSAQTFAKRAGRTIPATLPNLKALQAYVVKLEPLVILADLQRNRANLESCARIALKNYYSSMRALRTGASLAPQQIRKALSDTHNARSLARVRNACETVLNGGWNAKHETHKSKRIRDTLQSVRILARDTLAIVGPLTARVERMALRTAMEWAQDDANRQCLQNSKCETGLEFLTREADAIQKAEKMRADNPTLAHGFRFGYSDTYPADLQRRIARARLKSRETILETRRAAVVLLVSDFARAFDNGQPFAADRIASDMRATAASLADLWKDIQTLRAEIGATGPDYSQQVMQAQSDADTATARAADMQRDAIRAWRNNDRNAPTPAGTVFRLRPDGETIQSSRGAEVSVQAGARLWRMIRATVESGKAQSWDYGTGPRVGSFQLRALNVDGSAVVGCHEITASEARAFAEFMQWPPFGDRND